MFRSVGGVSPDPTASCRRPKSHFGTSIPGAALLFRDESHESWGPAAISGLIVSDSDDRWCSGKPRPVRIVSTLDRPRHDTRLGRSQNSMRNYKSIRWTLSAAVLLLAGLVRLDLCAHGLNGLKSLYHGRARRVSFEACAFFFNFDLEKRGKRKKKTSEAPRFRRLQGC